MVSSFLLARLVLLACSCVVVIGSVQSDSPLWTATNWTDAHATLDAGQVVIDAIPNSGACGYGNVYTQHYGMNTTVTALSNALFNNGLSCGACFQLVCKLEESTMSWCDPTKSIIVTATDNCPQDFYWCDDPKAHFGLHFAAFYELAHEEEGALIEIPIQFKRVSCTRQGGIRFTIEGNVRFIEVLVHNVGGGGDVQSVSIQGDSNPCVKMVHSWGQFWSTDANVVGEALTFQVVLGNGISMQFNNVADRDWSFGLTYEANSNF